ncbi:MAG: hypothetical protein JOY99_11105 [Sphingomonadaceae bacterium]|nr:hypothetical protein [Sphingomonadaceae bacterium]
MGAALRFPTKHKMATPWRRRRMCILIADRPSPAALRDISGKGATIETRAKVEIGRAVKLHHPDAGTIPAKVVGLEAGAVRLAFDKGERAMAFALAAITSDMSRPA